MVQILVDSFLLGVPNYRENPKSAITMIPLLLMKMFSGLRSLCSIIFLCRKLTPSKVWYAMTFKLT